jgi:peptide/nickel transport system permease protein
MGLVRWASRNRLGLAAGILAPWIAPYDPIRIELRSRLHGPSGAHLLGTDEFGRDVLSRVLWGSRTSLSVGFLIVGVATLLGVMLGLVSGYFGGVIDHLIMRAIDITLTFPTLLLALVLVAVLGQALVNIMLAVAIALTPTYARIVRSLVLSVKTLEFVTAARGLGASNWRIIGRDILPNIASEAVILATLNIAAAVLIESSLSFLGLGVQPPTPSWGSMISDGRKFLLEAPWISSSAGLAIMATVLGFNLAGDAFRDAWDPRLRGRR